MSQSKNDPVVAVWVGPDDAYLSGVPKRNLTRTMYNRLTTEQQKAVFDSGLYERPAQSGKLEKEKS